MTRTFAAADIGSNTAHLLVARTDSEIVMRVDNLNEWIPLGEVVARRGEIPKETAETLVLAMSEFRRIAESKGAESLYVFATEAVRVARNSEAVLKTIRRETGVIVDVITPNREAELSLRGVGLDTRHSGAKLLIEVGGGSAQIGTLDGDRFVERCSLPIGTGRVIAESSLVHPAPDFAQNAARRFVRGQLERCPLAPTGGLAVVCGGVARGLWRALHADGEKHMLPFELDYLGRATARLPVDRIVRRFSVKGRRAATLLPGSIIYAEILRRFEIEEILVSEFGVREGAILDLAAGRIAPPKLEGKLAPKVTS